MQADVRGGDMLFQRVVRRTIQVLAEAEWNAATKEQMRYPSRVSDRVEKAAKSGLPPILRRHAAVQNFRSEKAKTAE
jgi:hypothetical protein